MEATHSNSAAKKARVVLVEDHPIVRHGMRMMIDDEPDLTVCGEAGSVAEAQTMLGKLRPDVAVVDISLGDGSGLDLIKQVHERQPALIMLAMSMHDEAVYGERALRAGARGYIMKKEAMDKVLTAIRSVLAGNVFVSEKLTARMLNKIVDPKSAGAVSPVDALSDREFEVFRLIADGIGPSEMAQRLSVSVKTIETHREHIKEKLRLKSGVELSRFSFKWAMENR